MVVWTVFTLRNYCCGLTLLFESVVVGCCLEILRFVQLWCFSYKVWQSFDEKPLYICVVSEDSKVFYRSVWQWLASVAVCLKISAMNSNQWSWRECVASETLYAVTYLVMCWWNICHLGIYKTSNFIVVCLHLIGRSCWWLLSSYVMSDRV